MKHLGDITAIDWSKVEPVDVVTGGSPRQDLSVAGKRAGLAGERSGLFMEQIRCVKELRKADEQRGRTAGFIRPRYMVWENVPGAFSSGTPKGADFAAVIEEIIKIAEPRAAVSVCVPNGGWTKSGCYYAEDGSWSIAWRVHDAQFWGVPQRRKRIALVADFGGLSAPEILFERKGLRGHPAESGTPWQGIASDAERGAGADDRAGGNVGFDGYNGALTGTTSATLGVNCGISSGRNGVLQVVAANDQHLYQPRSLREENWAEGEVKNAIRAGESKSSHVVVQPMVYSFDSLASNSMKSKNPNSGCRQVEIAKTLDTTDPNPSKNQGGIAVLEPVTLEPGIAAREGGHVYEGVSGTLRANAGDNQMAVAYILDDQGGSQISVRTDGISPTLRAEMHGNVPCVMETAGFKELNSAKARSIGYGEEVAPTLSAEKYDACVCVKTWDARGNGDGDTVSTITGDHENCITDYTSAVVEPIPIHDKATRYKGGGSTRNDDGAGNGLGVGTEGDPMYTVTTGDKHAVAYEVYRQGGFADYVEGEVGTLRASGGDYGGGTENLLVEHLAVRYIVRRLTPLECERLQGYPDGWTNIGEWTDSKGKKHKEADSPRYKALGNSIALPFWKWLLKRISAQYERDATLGSLFDGIGGFPLCWEQINGKGTARWASEIEEFPIAVTKIRFPEATDK